MAASSYDAVADLYDAVVTFDADLPFLVEAARAAGGPVLELTAGTGRASLPLAREGVELVCVDGSRPMLDVLERRLRDERLAAEVVCADVRDLDLGRPFPLALFPFHALHELVEPDDRARALAAVRRHVADGGRFVCTLHNPAVRAASIDGEERALGEGADAAGRRVELRGRFTLDPATTIVTGTQTWSVDGVERATVPVRFALFAPDAFEAEARAAGFEVEERFGDYDRAPFDAERSPHAIFVLG